MTNATSILERRVARLNGLVEAGATINSSLDRRAVLRTVMGQISDLLASEAASIILLDETTDELFIMVSTDIPLDGMPDRDKPHFPKDRGIAGEVVTAGRTLNIPDVSQDPRHFGGVDKKTGFVTRSLLAVPLRVKDRVVGVLEALNRRDGGAFDREDERLFEAFADQVGMAVENARAYEESLRLNADLQRRMAELSRLQEIGETLASALDVDRAVEMALNAVVELLGFDRAWLSLVDEKRRVLGGGRCVGGTAQEIAFIQQREWSLDDLSSAMVRALVTNQPVLIEDVERAQVPLDRHAAAVMGVRSLVCVTLNAEGRGIGVMGADRSRSGGRITEADRETLARFADQVALALEIAQLHERALERERMEQELRTARAIQLGLMPQESPSVQGFEVAGTCIPAAEVGGDYFNYVWLDEGRTRLAFLVADVSGKGMRAATVTMRFNEVLRYEAQGRSAPQDILRGLDAALRGRIGELTFVTGCIGALDVAKRIVRIASAAHPMACHYAARDGSVRQVAPSGLPMGMTLPPGVGGDYPEAEAQMEAGDLLVIYSDGIPEAQDAKGEFYEDARVAEVIRGRAGQASAQALMDHLLRDVEAFRGEVPQLDDMTVVVVRCVG
ncbi:SpoIIE family protein phosphatase [bacterium]|nr:SpoIIE family protein phosphatase [bacterium]